MTKRKFKVGDRVVVNNKGIKPCRKVGTIVDCRGHEYTVRFDNWNDGHGGNMNGKRYKGGVCWYVNENWLSPALEAIVIYRNGNIVTALNKSTGERAEGCNPKDEFDFRIGAKLALEHLMEGNEINVGDMVTVVDKMLCYADYSHWEGLERYKRNFVCGKTPLYDKEYIVRNIAPHGTRIGTLALIQDLDTTQVFIMDVEAIKRN